MANRIEGQVWIGRDEPNVLKYFARGKEYWAVSATTYTAAAIIAKGMVVAVNSESTGNLTRESVIPAQWPRDTDKVVGVSLRTAQIGEPVLILNYGYVKFTRAELEACFTTKSDITCNSALTGTNYYANFGNMSTEVGGGNDWQDAVLASATRKGRGIPLYWFSGRTLKTGASSYNWVDSTSYSGKLTFSTPSGYKPTGEEIPWNDQSLNVAYKQLPIIGNVVNYTYDASYNVTELIVQINFSKFQRRVQFEYPAYTVNSGLLQHTGTATTDLVVRHGLFASEATGFKVPHCAVQAWAYNDNDPTSQTNDAHVIYPGYDSTITGADRKTEIEIISDSGFWYKILGEVNYSF